MQIKLKWKLSVSEEEYEAIDASIRQHCPMDGFYGLTPECKESNDPTCGL